MIVEVSFMKPYLLLKPETKILITKLNLRMGLINQTPTL